jgi:hypothetical protein
MHGDQMSKQQFTQRLKQAGARAREFATQFIIEELPDQLVFSLQQYDNPRGKRGPAGTLKFLGGRFLRPEQLVGLEAWRAAALLWADGKVPAWVNLAVSSCTDTTTEIKVSFCTRLVPAVPSQLPRDIGASPKNELAPFRIRGPRGSYLRRDGKPIRFSLTDTRQNTQAIPILWTTKRPR